jgi:UDP-N-acetylglucosamine 2-epimerase (hydrolysing)
MHSINLPTLEEAKNKYDVNFKKYSIAIFHPVTTEYHEMKANAKTFIDSLIESNKKYILIKPNNDLGTTEIFREIERIENNPNFRIFPSMKFEFYLTFLKNSNFLIGNSSSGIYEAPVYGIPTINIGSRQNNRFSYESISNVNFNHKEILETIEKVDGIKYKPTDHYGKGDSAIRFIESLEDINLWETSKQKIFIDRHV